MRENKWMTRKRIIWLLVFVAVGVFLFRHSISGSFFVLLDYLHLPHYSVAKQIASADFEALESETEVFGAGDTFDILQGTTSGRNAKPLPVEVGLVLKGARVDEKINGTGILTPMLVHDLVKGTYHYFDSFDLEFGRNKIHTFEVDTTQNSVVPRDFPHDERWKTVERFACFSCGCGCYFEKNLLISNDHYFVNIIGENYAMRPDKQGVYFLKKDNTWLKLTPKTGSDIKITNGGCTVSYMIATQAYSLNACEL